MSVLVPLKCGGSISPYQGHSSSEIPGVDTRKRSHVIMIRTYHFKGGFECISDTFIPKIPARKVSGRKIKVIQLSRHKLVLSSRDWRASRIAIDLYICKDKRLIRGQTASVLRIYQIYHLSDRLPQ